MLGEVDGQEEYPPEKEPGGEEYPGEVEEEDLKLEEVNDYAPDEAQSQLPPSCNTNGSQLETFEICLYRGNKFIC